MLDQLTILAPGLLGGSVAMAAHARKAARHVGIWARRAEVRQSLRGQPWCNEVFDTVRQAVGKPGLIILAAPVEKIIELAREIGPVLPEGAIVTDVGSVKARLCRECTAAMRPGIPFVGSHPMAGSQKTGWENGSADLFDGRTCFVTPLAGTPDAAVQTVCTFWAEIGAKVATVEPEQHDEIVAHISHLPQVLATTLCDLLSRKDPALRGFAGGGLRDTTRIAGSDATMWIEIFQQNREEILRAVRDYQNELSGFQEALVTGDWARLRQRMEQGKAYRDGFPG